jgi:hypothetical protein
MHTLALQNRDLVVGPGTAGFATYTGSDRLQQDLTLALGEEYGNDRFHPRFGSILFDMVGEPVSDILKQEIMAEVNRVISNYTQIQQSFMQQDIINAINSRFATGDVLAGIVSVSSQLDMDAINIVITVKNLDNAEIQVLAGASA